MKVFNKCSADLKRLEQGQKENFFIVHMLFSLPHMKKPPPHYYKTQKR